ncbi:MAG: AI-2E family transporter [Sedimentibacter sp.]|uniref:AI-2E family transporter n=1 Tax=Sedimentibacter sp. TaxID=1960295 RepID=UPI0029828FB8|nr:AI-2E family transporter [Sedimentibacter sp.]MDW5299665.1 AI-2E family transporter [Sedimentibacter sp.]
MSLPILAMVLLILLCVFSPHTFGWIAESFKPVIYALVIAYLLDSVVTFFMKKLKVRRAQGIFLACIILIGLIGTLIYKVVPQIVENINNIMTFIMDGNVDIVQILSDMKNKIDNQYFAYVTDYILQASQSVKSIINDLLIEMSNFLMKLVTNIGSSTFTVVTSFIINIYMLSEKEDILARGRRLIYAYFDKNTAKKYLYVFSRGNSIFKSFLNGKILDSTIVGIICVIVFYIFKVPYAPLLGTIIGVFNIIPYFGPIIGSVPVIVVSFFVDPPKALTALIIILVIQQLDANILDPKIVGGNVGVSPFWIITSVTVGGNLFGVPGMILGVPIVVLIKTIVEESIEMRLIEKGIGDIEKDNMHK